MTLLVEENFYTSLHKSIDGREDRDEESYLLNLEGSVIVVLHRIRLRNLYH